MTETRAPYRIPAQMDLFGIEAPPAGLNRDEKVAYVLERWPECRNDDRLLFLKFWEVFDGLGQILGEEAWRRFRATFPKITHPETIRRGRQEVQKLRDGGGSLLPEPHEADRRRSLDGAGSPDRRRW